MPTIATLIRIEAAKLAMTSGEQKWARAKRRDRLGYADAVRYACVVSTKTHNSVNCKRGKPFVAYR